MTRRYVHPREFTCSDCGAHFFRTKAKAHARCPDCAVAFGLENARQIHEHAGPQWEALLAGQARRRARLEGEGTSRES